MIKTKGISDQTSRTKTKRPPHLKVARIGIVSRDYRYEYRNGFRDFSEAFSDILKLLDDEELRYGSVFPVQHRPSKVIYTVSLDPASQHQGRAL